jgi:2'-hydroxyisoflavone reductase
MHAPHRQDLEIIVADRDGDLAAVQGRRWDVAVDVAGYLPRTVATSTRVLRHAVERYVFVSTLNVYAELRKGVSDASTLVEIDEATVARFESMSTEEARAAPGFFDAYGGLKARCESIVGEAFGDRALLVRPGLIVGPHDTTDRFTYWPWRLARGGEVLAPEGPERPTRFVDVRDLTEWMVQAIATSAIGAFDVMGATELTLGDVLETCRAAAASDATLTWVDEAFLLDNKVEPWTELPLWLPRAWSTAFRGSDERARVRGLSFRPLSKTVRDVLDWDRGRTAAPRKNGLDPKREADLLAAFHRAR